MPGFLDRLAEARQAEIRKIAAAQDRAKAREGTGVTPYVLPMDELERIHDLGRAKYESGPFPDLLARFRGITGAGITLDYKSYNEYEKRMGMRMGMKDGVWFGISNGPDGKEFHYPIPSFPETSYVVKVAWTKLTQEPQYGPTHSLEHVRGFFLEFREHDVVGYGSMAPLWRKIIVRSSDEIVRNPGLAEDVLEGLYKRPLTLVHSFDYGGGHEDHGGSGG